MVSEVVVVVKRGPKLRIDACPKVNITFAPLERKVS